MEPHSPQSMSESMNVFDDEFAVDDYDVVADGFAPGRVGMGMGTGMGTGMSMGMGMGGNSNGNGVGYFEEEEEEEEHEEEDDGAEVCGGNTGNAGQNQVGDAETPVQSVDAYMTDMTMATTPTISRLRGNRNSIRKPRDIENPFRSAEDDDNDAHSALGRTPSIRSQSTVTTSYAPGITHRSVSSTSSRAFAPSQSPFQPASGPSHPYAMYPQDTNLARTASVSTTSTMRPQRQPPTQQGPAHPYSMYPQNVSGHVDDDNSAAADDDDDDDDGRGRGAPHVQAHIPVGFPGRNATYNLSHGPQGEEQDIIGVDGHTEQLPPYSEYPEDGVPKHIVLPAQVAAMAAAAAAAAATAAASAARTSASPTPISHPIIPPVPAQPQSMSDVGNHTHPQAFATMEQMESNTSSSTAHKRWRDKSWKEKRKTKFCGIPFWWILLSMCVLAFIAIVLGGAIGGFMGTQKKSDNGRPGKRPPTATSLIDASAIPTASSGPPPPTGTYALTLGTPEAVQSACLINQSYSPAWSCNIPGPQALGISIENPPSNSAGWQGACLLDTSEKNGYSNITYGTQTPSTSFSQFLAVNDNDDLARGPAFYFQAFYNKVVVAPPDSFSHASSSSSKRDSEHPRFHVPSSWYTRHQIVPGEQPWFCYWNSTFLEGFIYSKNISSAASSSSTSTKSSPSSTPAATPFTTTSTIIEVSGPHTTSTLTSPPSATSTTSTWPNNAANIVRAYMGDYYQELPSFDYVVKIEERRIPGTPTPYCQKMQILDDGTAGIVTDGSGAAIKINLDEEDPGYGAYVSSSGSRRSKRADTTPGGCHCQWWSGL